MAELLVIVPGRVYKEGTFSILVARTGEHLASHYCSNYSFAYGDLYERRKERIEDWTKRFGELEVKYIDETDLTEEIMHERNEKWFNENNPVYIHNAEEK
jgi:hypothetical protein